MLKKLLLLLTIISVSSCASLRSVSITDIPAKRSNTVEAKVEKLIFLGFNFDNDYVDDLSSDLARQCKKGKISGILTKHETYFYFFAHKVIITAEGICTKNGRKA